MVILTLKSRVAHLYASKEAMRTVRSYSLEIKIKLLAKTIMVARLKPCTTDRDSGITSSDRKVVAECLKIHFY